MLPISVVEAERSFSMLACIISVLRSTMCQNRLTSLGVLAIECQLAWQLNFDDIIGDFASRKARMVLITGSKNFACSISRCILNSLQFAVPKLSPITCKFFFFIYEHTEPGFEKT